jgi:hypothetical protein
MTFLDLDEFEDFESPRDDLGRFRPGHSGNPKGRPPGSQNFSTMVTEALAAELKAETGETLTLKEYMSQVVAGILVNGTYRTLDGENIKVSSRDLLPFLMNVWKKLEPNTHQIDLTTGGEKIDFSRLDDKELRGFIEGSIAETLISGVGSEEEGAEAETPKHGDSTEGLPADDPAEDVSVGHETS